MLAQLTKTIFVKYMAASWELDTSFSRIEQTPETNGTVIFEG